MIKVVVTGGAGFIGSHLVDALVEKGYEVHIIDDLSTGQKENINPKAVFHNLDIRNKEKIDSVFSGADYVFHQAALAQVQFSIENPIETHEVNVTGVINILELSRRHNVKRVIFASSSSVYGDQDILPFTEDIKPSPLSPYAAHKLIGEIYCKLYSDIYKLETVSLRYFNAYGPRQRVAGAYPWVLPVFMELYKNGKPLTVTGDGNQTRSFINVKDIVSANLLAMNSDKVGNGEVINIGTDKMHSINDIANLIGGDINYIEPRVEPRATCADVTLAKEVLGWEPKVSLEQGISELKSYIK